MQWIASWCVLLATLVWFVARAPRFRRTAVSLGALCCAALAAGQLAWGRGPGRARAERSRLAAELPRPTRAGGYVSSDACRACHAGQHASWHRSYHRTMTQVASPVSVRGAFDGTRLVHEGRTHVL